MKLKTSLLLMAVIVYSVGSSWASEYVVKRGDTLTSIAKAYRSTVPRLAEANGIRNPDRITVGQRIVIPGSSDISGNVDDTGYGRDYENPGPDAFDGTLAEAAKLLGLDADQAERLKEKASRRDYDPGQLKRGDHVRVMVFGKNRGGKSYRV